MTSSVSTSDRTALPRRRFVQTSLALAAAAATTNAAPNRPKLGIIAHLSEKISPDQAIARVKRLGFPTCQISVGTLPATIAAPLKEALDKHQIEGTAMMTLGPGKMVWDFEHGPRTIGLVPRETRAARIDALKRASDIGKVCGVPAVHTHCGFIPEDPEDPMYPEVVAAIREVATHCKANGQKFLMETGQETPITVLRTIQDAGLDNVGVNLDTANLILYGKGEPVGAMDVLGKHVYGLHAKDGLYPTDPKKLGTEVAIGAGRVDFPTVMKQLRALNYTGPITIEREIAGPKQEADIMASKQFLEKLISSHYA